MYAFYTQAQTNRGAQNDQARSNYCARIFFIAHGFITQASLDYAEVKLRVSQHQLELELELIFEMGFKENDMLLPLASLEKDQVSSFK